ncbi:hypothetical protein IFM89_008506 [Coptis chinensis]|uniref:60S ribosomal protein L5 n=1 Tax=Coptis chinensis TaxID=261450 RepID=A0A835HBI2_9MAGN|nr:hypothetical protein IFM89_008506 [Coptis chinensis]
MVFIKPTKSRAYFKSVIKSSSEKRVGKTDYGARSVLSTRTRTSHGTPKYRFVVRFTNKDIITRLYLLVLLGDMILTSAYAHEPPDMGLMLEGNVEATGEDFSIELTDSRRPFRALLDVGLIRTTTGALKGALDGGLDIPHSDKRFAGFKKENKQFDAGVHRKYVYGGHVAAYMMTLIEDEPEKYQTHFSEYIKKGIEADGIEELYRKVHAGIRADPTA